MYIEKSPLLTLDKQTVIGHLKAAGSRDPDILHSHKATLVSAAKFPKLAGIYIMIIGALLTLTILGAFLGIPALIIGWWMRRRGVNNLKAVEAGLSEYTSAVAA